MSYIAILVLLVAGTMILGYRTAVRSGARRRTRMMALVPLAAIAARPASS